MQQLRPAPYDRSGAQLNHVPLSGRLNRSTYVRRPAADMNKMAISARTRTKRINASHKLLPGTTIISYSEAVAGPNPKRVRLCLGGGAVAISLVVFALTHIFVFPGLLLLILVRDAINPGRGVVVDSFGVAIVER